MKRTLAILVVLTLCATALLAEVSFPERAMPTNVTGVVTFHRPGDAYYFMQNDMGEAWRIHETNDQVTVKAGDRVHVTGLKWGRTALNRMEEAHTEKVGRSFLPAPLELTAEELYTPSPDEEMGRRSWYGRLAMVSGVVADVNRRETMAQILIAAGKERIAVNVPVKWSDPLPEGLALRSVIRVRGVPVYTEHRDDERKIITSIDNFAVLVERLDDIKVVTNAPFWTFGRVAILVGILFGIMALVVALLQRQRVRERIAADAARRERLRLTSELHDNFQQLLAGCLFRLGAAMGRVREDDVAVREQLELLNNSLDHTQASLRAALWGLTEEAEGPSALSDLMRYAASRLPQWEGVVRFTVRGRERAVARQCSGVLLLILQEAVGNALKHGAASRVDIVIDFTDKFLLVGVTDDGCGFDVAKKIGAGHLGLTTMRKHVENLKGTFLLTSVPGQGTTISIKLPLEEG